MLTDAIEHEKPTLMRAYIESQLQGAVNSIQEYFDLYNYELFQSEAIQEESSVQEKSSITMSFYAPVDVATGNVEGNFINSAGKDPDQEVNPWLTDKSFPVGWVEHRETQHQFIFCWVMLLLTQPTRESGFQEFCQSTKVNPCSSDWTQ